MTRCQGNIHLIEQLDVIGQTSEFSRVFGIQFYEVLSRGSQVRIVIMSMIKIRHQRVYMPIYTTIYQLICAPIRSWSVRGTECQGFLSQAGL